MTVSMLAVLLAANLGVSHFTATGPKACKQNVLQGVLYLHSFMYDDARDAFVAAEKAAPCPIAFWGEAMTYDHPLWGQHDEKAGKAALEKIPANIKISTFERGLIEAARALYEKGPEAWMERLGALQRELPNDDEVALFYSLSLYANSNHGQNTQRAVLAANLARDVFERNPDHPGAAHYFIHACDSPDMAHLALKAARRYAQIAPAAGHALHMPSHIFLQLGLWKDVEASNLASVKAGEANVARRHEPISHADWHSYSWLASAKLELGKSDEVLPMIARVRELAEKEPSLREIQAEIALKWLAATQEWSKLDEVMKMAPLPAEDEPGFVDRSKYEGAHHSPYELNARLTVAHARLDAAAAEGDEAMAQKAADEFIALRERIAKHDHMPDQFLTMGKVVTAAKIAQAHSVRFTGDIGDAIEKTRIWADLEDKRPAIGPWTWTPAREELGELFLRSHRFAEAQQAFQAALAKRPNRFHALEGLAEAARSAGDLKTANEAQDTLAAQVH